MNNLRLNNKGVVLIIVLATLFVVVLLANIILGLMSSQSRLTHHQVSRIQAYYADWGGVNYAYDKLRKGDDPKWLMPASGSSYTRKICRSDAGCTAPDIVEPNLDKTAVKEAIIAVCYRNDPCPPASGSVPAGPACQTPSDAIPVCISVTSTYTYAP